MCTHAVDYGTHLLHAQLKFSRSKLSTAHLSAAVSLFRPTHTDSSSPNIVIACFDENKTGQNMAIMFLEHGALKYCFIATWIKSKQIKTGIHGCDCFLLVFCFVLLLPTKITVWQAQLKIRLCKESPCVLLIFLGWLTLGLGFGRTLCFALFWIFAIRSRPFLRGDLRHHLPDRPESWERIWRRVGCLNGPASFGLLRRHHQLPLRHSMGVMEMNHFKNNWGPDFLIAKS